MLPPSSLAESADNPDRRRLCLAFAALAAVPLEALAKRHPVKKTASAPNLPKRAAVNAPKSWIAIDAQSGDRLDGENEDERRGIASQAKIMTAIRVFEAFKSGRLRRDQMIPFTDKGPALVADKNVIMPGFRPGIPCRVEDLLKVMIVRSACDAAATLAESLGNGSESEFAKDMNRTARLAGMKNTNFTNASGIEDPDQYSTARDMANLSRYLIRHYAEFYNYFKMTSVTLDRRLYPKNAKLHYDGHNHLLVDYKCKAHLNVKYSCADGIKTGFFTNTGYGGAFSAVKDGYRVIVDVFGEPTGWARDRKATYALDRGVAVLQERGAPKTAPATEWRFPQIGPDPVVVPEPESLPDPNAAPSPAAMPGKLASQAVLSLR